jgi:NAD(P)H-hydrate epimerase
LKPVLTVAQMRECDRITIEELGIPGIQLMENASCAVANQAIEMLEFQPGRKRITILCGKGNNGGDGLAAARHLTEYGALVSVYLAGSVSDLTGDAAHNRDRWIATGGELVAVGRFEDIPDSAWTTDLLIDGLLGTGTRGNISNLLEEIIGRANNSKCPILSIDIPSGINGETGQSLGSAIHSAETVTFACPKPGLLLGEGRKCAGRLTCVDIGIPDVVIEGVRPAIWQVEPEDVASRLPRRAIDAHKWDVGFVFILTGSPGLTGAGCLSALAALRTGAGQVIAGVPASLNPIYEVKLTEAMSDPLPEEEGGCLGLVALERILARVAWADAVAIGPGLGRSELTGDLIQALIPKINKPLVLDADALWHLAKRPELLKNLPPNSILTPHIVEMSRLTGLTPETIAEDRIAVTRKFAAEWNAVIHLKGAPSLTVIPDGSVFFNTTGNPGMATGGSGDVLTGVMTALLAGGMKPDDAAWSGAFLHGRAGDLAAEMRGGVGLIASDFIDRLPTTLRELA